MALNDTDHLRTWSYRRQLLDRCGASPLLALEQVIAVHGTHPPAPLSLLSRTPAMDWEQFAKLEEEKHTVRLPAMRGSVHLMPVSAAPFAIAATRPSPSRLLTSLKYEGLDLADYERMKPDLLARLQKPVDGANIRRELGITAAEFLVMRLMSREGLVLRLATTPRTDRLRYVATEAWLGQPLPEVSPEQGLSWLAREYLMAFGPARIKDVAWWIGESQGKVKTALAGADLREVSPGMLLPATLADAFAATASIDPAAIVLLPKWDSYTMSYAPNGRQRFVDDAHLPYAYSTTETKIGATSGDGWPLILRGGRAVARWGQRFATETMQVTVEPFPGEVMAEDEILQGFEEIATLMRCTKLEIVIEAVKT